MSKKSTQVQPTPDPTETVQYWKDQVQELKKEVSELKQKNNDRAELDDELDFDDMFVSFCFLFRTCYILFYYSQFFQNIYNILQAGKSRRRC